LAVSVLALLKLLRKAFGNVPFLQLRSLGQQ